MTVASVAARPANRSLPAALAEAEERYVRANPASQRINAAARINASSNRSLRVSGSSDVARLWTDRRNLAAFCMCCRRLSVIQQRHPCAYCYRKNLAAVDNG